MSGKTIIDEVRSLLSFKLKQRNDSISDQFSRIVVSKIFVLASIIMLGSRFNDQDMNCVIPQNMPMSKDFVQHGCWARGFYIYPHLGNLMDQSSYYGIPRELKYKGYLKNDHKHLCELSPSGNKDQCIPMPKEYFMQFQSMPFIIFVLAYLFYVPYIVFCYGHIDIIHLKDRLQAGGIDANQICVNYFNHKVFTKCGNNLRIATEYLAKMLYIVNNVFVFYLISWLTNYRFISYGNDWIKFSQNRDASKYDFYSQTEPTPGNRFLPTFAMCDLDVIHSRTYSVRLTVVCEVSSYLYFQYTFVLLWFILVLSISISILGLLVHLTKHLKYIVFLCYAKKTNNDLLLTDKLYAGLTLRETEYLDAIKYVDFTMYIQVLRELARYRPVFHQTNRKLGDDYIALLPSIPNTGDQDQCHDAQNDNKSRMRATKRSKEIE
ncbi:innexin-6-like [Clytia hemisphaerica]|uniref:innexin-6-like n=1 Tax=Clytia hemisphaerica TaxID=252671 RepID=UPI0034D5FA87